LNNSGLLTKVLVCIWRPTEP